MPDPTDGKRVIFVKCRLEGENSEPVDSCDCSYFRDMFPEEKLKEYLGELEEVWNKNVKCDGGACEIEEDYDWFFSERVPYFLEDDNGMDTGRKDESTRKCESSINGHNLEEKKGNCEVEEQRLLDEYDEETVLQQIPQDDTRIEDVVKRFENQNRVVDTLAVLQDKGKIIAGQENMRRLVASEVESLGEADVSRLSKWTCGQCGATFYAQGPFRNYDERAICRGCWKKLIEGERCSEDIWSGSKEYCIFHDPSPDKDKKLFEEKLNEKFKKEDYTYTGYYFPEVDFENKEFGGRVLFDGVTFLESASFSGATFHKEADFYGTVFRGRTFFKETAFSGNTDFGRAFFRENVDFRNAAFRGETFFKEATFGGNTSFSGAMFH